MKRINNYEEILKDCPDTITKEQLYKVCHISKRTALFLLESGLIPCKDSGKQTRKYTIAKNDVIAYLEQRDKTPEAYLPPDGWYGGNYRRKITNSSYVLSDEEFVRMRTFYSEMLHAYPDVLSVEQIEQFTGYSSTTVPNWCQKRQIHRFQIGRKYMIPKESLLDFMLSLRFRRIQVKSQKHLLYLKMMGF